MSKADQTVSPAAKSIVDAIDRHDWISLQQQVSKIENQPALANDLVQRVRVFVDGRPKVRTRSVIQLDGIAMKWDIIGLEAPGGEVLFVSIGRATIATGDVLMSYGVNSEVTKFDLRQ